MIMDLLDTNWDLDPDVIGLEDGGFLFFIQGMIINMGAMVRTFLDNFLMMKAKKLVQNSR